MGLGGFIMTGRLGMNFFWTHWKDRSDMKKVKKFPLAEFLGFIISAKKSVILDMSKAIEKCENYSIFSKLDIY